MIAPYKEIGLIEWKGFTYSVDEISEVEIVVEATRIVFIFLEDF